jgi:hypothetical protein
MPRAMQSPQPPIGLEVRTSRSDQSLDHFIFYSPPPPHFLSRLPRVSAMKGPRCFALRLPPCQPVPVHHLRARMINL